ncbi:serine/threonine protein kinase [Streptomyces sp. MMG1121]|uniref:serine/threonine protein kinase n=1 Tax=Streptomyces sp. MMG1121 TaxID=1415544 RepID=UPI0006ADE3EF|nr:serine/threonine protein kinase [Streptomyces sp. MMG1121]KOV70156.1 serine-threonine protein kinase [Streptomyces sp. MMG1121]
MADPGMSVTPYWELTFDADGDVDGPERDQLVAQVTAHGVRDLIVFAHGWNDDRSGATALYRRFFAPIPGLAPRARIGYVGVIWPSMRFSDEPIPNFPKSTAAAPAQSAALDADTRRALVAVFPDRAALIGRLARMLDERPGGAQGLTEFGALVRQLIDGERRPGVADTEEEGEPGVFTEDPATACEEFAEALAAVRSAGAAPGFSIPNPWDGAKELLRQATYYTMKRRGGTIGEHGLGPVIERLAAAAPGVRVHLTGHSFGGRLVSFALRGLPDGVRTVKSLTLLQGAFSHYAFAERLPQAPDKAGALKDRQRRIDGPLVCCYSHFDQALGTFYPLASRLSGDDRSAVGSEIAAVLGPEWGALGHDGVQAVPGAARLDLAAALNGSLPTSGCVSVDAAAVVCHGGPPAGAHSDIVHPELARVVLAAGRIS